MPDKTTPSAEQKERSSRSNVSFDLGDEEAERKEAGPTTEEEVEKKEEKDEEVEETRRPRCLKRSKAAEQARAQRMRRRIQEANAGGRIQDLHDEVG